MRSIRLRYIVDFNANSITVIAKSLANARVSKATVPNVYWATAQTQGINLSTIDV